MFLNTLFLQYEVVSLTSNPQAGEKSWSAVQSLTLREKFKLRVFKKQDPEANIWVQERWEWGVERAPQ